LQVLCGSANSEIKSQLFKKMTTIKKLGITVVLLWTFGVTIMRSIRFPNEYAMAHWLIDYRFGLIKRGLAGTIVSLSTGIMHMRPTEQLIVIISICVFTVFCLVLISLGLRTIHQAGWSTAVILAVLVFFSSPFIVMSAHLMGYFDNIIIILSVISIILLLKGRIWSAAWLQVISVLVHESSLLIGFPAFFMAWVLVNSKRQESDDTQLPFAPLLLPSGAFLILALIQSIFFSGSFDQTLSAHLSKFQFIPPYTRTWFAKGLTATFYLYLVNNWQDFLIQISSVSMYVLVLPSMLAIQCFILDAYSIKHKAGRSVLLLGSICLVPQMLQMIAWDTAKIWTYSILCAFMVLWINAEVFTARRDSSPSIILFCLPTLVVNIMSLTPLMDSETDHFSLKTRLLLYAPVIVFAMALMLREEIALIKNQFLFLKVYIQGKIHKPVSIPKYPEIRL
jgi:hypothetical protein